MIIAYASKNSLNANDVTTQSGSSVGNGMATCDTKPRFHFRL